MIVLDNISKSYGGQALFDAASFRVNPRERIGLVGRNGHGKTTLFRLIAGLEKPDSGSITVPKNYQISHLKQHLDFTRDTVVSEAASSIPQDEVDETWKAEKVLSGLGFSETDFTLSPYNLSGGFQIRLSLAKVILAEPDLLLLDEPNNYLDITSIRWLTRFLASWKGELILITHDRGFMDSVSTHTMGIHRCIIRKVAGSTEQLYNQIAQEEEIYEKTRVNNEQRKKEIEQFINRFRAKARLANMVQSRIKMLKKMEEKERLASIKNLDFSFLYKHFNGKSVMSLDSISFGYSEDLQLIKNLTVNIGPTDRICVIGKNGKGKSTLLKLMSGILKPLDGEILLSQNTVPGYYEQSKVQSLSASMTVMEVILHSHSNVDTQRAWDICGTMMFSGDDVKKTVEVLSGGEKSRLVLGQLLVTPANLLILDEPTNHLDMDSCDTLIAALDNFPGAVVIVTHNEMFLNALAERLIIFQDNSVSLFEGNYERFLEQKGWNEEENVARANETEEESTDTQKTKNKRELRKQRSEIITKRSKVLKPLENSINKLEDAITEKESELKNLHESMVTASHEKDGIKIEGLSRSIHQCQETIDKLFDELESVTRTYDDENAQFGNLLTKYE